MFIRAIVAACDCSVFSLSCSRENCVYRRDGRDQRVTPASTFKIAISCLMGYDSGFLKDEHLPALPFHEGYPAWDPERF